MTLESTDELISVGITVEQGEAISLGDARAEVIGSLDDQEPVLEEEVEAQQVPGIDPIPPFSCIYYPIIDSEETVWEFCFEDDVLVSSSEVGG